MHGAVCKIPPTATELSQIHSESFHEDYIRLQSSLLRCFLMQLRCQAAQFSLSSSCFQAALLGAWQKRIWCWNNPLHLILHTVPFVMLENFTVLSDCMFSPKDIKRNVRPVSICITVKKPFLNSAGSVFMPTLQMWQPLRVSYSNQDGSGFFNREVLGYYGVCECIFPTLIRCLS